MKKLLSRVLIGLIVFSMLSILAGMPVLAETVDEDPFNYTGEYVIDSTKLSVKEKAALPYMQKYALEYKISPALIMAIIKRESNHDPNAIGDIGLTYPAYGYMQVRWPAAHDAGYTGTAEQWKTDGLDPDKNIKYGTGYLRKVYEKWESSPVYDDPLKNAISAYNAGITVGPTKTNEPYVNDVIAYYNDYKGKYIEKTFTVEIEIDKFILFDDVDPEFGPYPDGVVDPYFKINIIGIDDDNDPSTNPDDDWFRAPQDRWELDLMPEDLDKSFGGPLYVPKEQVILPLTLTVQAWDNDWPRWWWSDYLIAEETFEVETLPFVGFIVDEEMYLRVSIREVPTVNYDESFKDEMKDEKIGNQWYWFDLKANLAMHHYGGLLNEVIVAVIDTGVNYNYEDLDDVIWENPGETGIDFDGNPKKSNGIDDDGNGYVDDWNGFDFYDGYKEGDIWYQDENGPLDEHGHGTFIAGIIAAERNSKAIAGIAPNVKIMPIRIGTNYADRSLADEAIDYAVQMGAKVISMSYGEPLVPSVESEPKPEEEREIEEAYENGVFLVAAAGNHMNSRTVYPAAYDKVVIVSGLQRLNLDDSSLYSTHHPQNPSYLAFADEWISDGHGGSNYGPDTAAPRTVEFSAPGTEIYSVWLDNLEYHNGTSFACPAVSAVAAMVVGYTAKEYGVDLSPDQIHRILRASTIDLGPPGWDPYYGYGIVNAYEALQKVDELFLAPNVDVVLVIDRSGSMVYERDPSGYYYYSPQKMENAKVAAKQFVDLMQIGDEVGVVSYSSNVRIDHQLSEILSDDTKATVKNIIDGISAGGMTAMGDGLRTAYNQLVSFGTHAHPWAIVLMSNGWHNYGSEHPYDVIPDLKSKNIKVYTIGLGKGADMGLLGKIASDTGGFSRFAPTPSDLLEVYNDIRAAVAQEQVISSVSDAVAEGETIQTSIEVDSSITQATFTISWGGSDLDLELLRPDGMLIDPDFAVIDPNIEYIEEARYEMYRIWNPMSGTWTMLTTGASVPTETETFVASLTAVTNVILSLATNKDSYTHPQPMKITVSLQDWGTPIIGADVQAVITRPDLSQVAISLFDDGQSIHGDDMANDGIYTNNFKQYTEDGSYTIKAIATGTTLTGEAFSRQAQKTVLVFGVPVDTTPPKTAFFIGSPQYVDATGNTYVTSDTLFTLIARDNNGAGSGVATIAYRIYNGTYDSGWITYTAPFNLTGLSDGDYEIGYNSTDNAGNIEPTNTATVILDNAGPSITILNPPAGWALQDGVTFIAQATDLSGTCSLNFSIREANSDQGIPVGFEDIPATYNTTTEKWELFFDTLQLPDGFYIVLVSAEDNLGHIASMTVPYSIRNWAVLELLPASENNKARRTMPVKFALRVAASVDPDQPFVYNEELTIKIYVTDDPTNILQTSTFGDTARDYRINTLSEHYITNFKTLKTPKTYTVEVWRKDMLIGWFEFSTVK